VFVFESMLSSPSLRPRSKTSRPSPWSMCVLCACYDFSLRRWRRDGAVAPFSHELIELSLVLGLPQTTKEILKFVLLLFEIPQGFSPIFLEGLAA